MIGGEGEDGGEQLGSGGAGGDGCLGLGDGELLWTGGGVTKYVGGAGVGYCGEGVVMQMTGVAGSENVDGVDWYDIVVTGKCIGDSGLHTPVYVGDNLQCLSVVPTYSFCLNGKKSPDSEQQSLLQLQKHCSLQSDLLTCLCDSTKRKGNMPVLLLVPYYLVQ